MEGDGRFVDVDRVRGLVSIVLVWKSYSAGLFLVLGGAWVRGWLWGS